MIGFVECVFAKSQARCEGIVGVFLLTAFQRWSGGVRKDWKRSSCRHVVCVATLILCKEMSDEDTVAARAGGLENLSFHQ